MNGLYLAASGAASQLAGLDISANNLANIGTPGFRRVLDMVDSVSGDSPYDYPDTAATPRLDMSQGPLKETGNPLDIAISGPAFLIVQTPDGPLYTRNGELQIGADGQLLAAGFPVSSEGGGTIALQAGKVSFGSDGTVSVNGSPAGKLALADPTGVDLAPAGAGLYRPIGSESLPPANSGSEIHQGFVEGATTSEVGEMVEMMGAMRSYESAMKAVTTIDQNQDKAIQAFTIQA